MNETAAAGRMIGRKEGPIAHLVFDNPTRRNAVSASMWAAIPPILDGFAADPEIRVLVVSGSGDKAFVSGADISEFDKTRASRADAERSSRVGAEAMTALRTFARPVVAMIRGFCLGGGLNVALACDLRIATEDAQFGIPAARLGNGYGESGLAPLVATVGPAIAKEILFTARRYTAHEALALGLVSRVVPAAELESFTRDYALGIAANAPMTITAVKSVVNELTKDESRRDMATARELVMRCFDSRDFKEGRAAFKDKRKPIFVGA
jgi:enoyl-CoA hydratase/carnithine racemase